MSEDDLLTQTDVPTLHSVVSCGNESIIKTTRLGHEIEDELASLPADVSYLQDDLTVENELELMIDEVVDRHITSLRRDLRNLLEHARSSR